MKLLEIFNQLKHSELSQASIGGQEAGVINEANYDVLINQINLGLIDLHTRFSLKKGRFKLILYPDINVYHMSSRYSLDNRRSREQIRYIEKIDAPFVDDLTKIERILTKDGREIPLNTGEVWSCFTPSSHILRVPDVLLTQSHDLCETLKTPYLEIGYRATHPKIEYEEDDDLDPEEVDIQLPYAYLTALLYFIGSRLHHTNGMSNNFHLGSSYTAKYEQECKRLEAINLEIDEGSVNHRLRRKGWV